MKRLGVRKLDTVVCYDTGDLNIFSFRAAWILEAMGHENVKVLDGGFKKWKEESHPVDKTDPFVSEDDFCYRLDKTKIASYDQIKKFGHQY